MLKCVMRPPARRQGPTPFSEIQVSDLLDLQILSTEQPGCLAECFVIKCVACHKEGNLLSQIFHHSLSVILYKLNSYK
jgi:hypothetical protein